MSGYSPPSFTDIKNKNTSRDLKNHNNIFQLPNININKEKINY